ncbi:MAG TPA: hypothetical protein PL041_09190 [Melioribacteraceae bacterium]|nr:hypothetical protein [Melioribacteraceae bacterium]
MSKHKSKKKNDFNSISNLKSILIAVNRSMEIEGCKPSKNRKVIKQAKAFAFEK